MKLMDTDDILKIKYPLIIDGGLSNVLEEQGCDLNHKLWTASLLDKNPNSIVLAHLDYLKSGAQCITTASYQASISGLIDIGYTRIKAESLIIKSVQLAEDAVRLYMDSGRVSVKPLIAASIGPYGAYLADGSEYHGGYDVSNETLRVFHIDRIRILDNSNADLIACETIPSFQEAKVLSDILNQVNKPAWVSFSCRDENHLNDGTNIENCVSLFRDHSKVFAIGVNCTNPRFISGLIKGIKSCVGDKRIIIYPNSGEAYNAKSKTWLGISEPKLFVEMTKEWTKIGADIIGGCCRISPKHIRRMRKVLVDS